MWNVNRWSTIRYFFFLTVTTSCFATTPAAAPAAATAAAGAVADQPVGSAISNSSADVPAASQSNADASERWEDADATSGAAVPAGYLIRSVSGMILFLRSADFGGRIRQCCPRLALVDLEPFLGIENDF